MPQDTKTEVLQHSADLSKMHATIVHVFDFWNAACAKLIRQAYQLRIPVVYSPLGSFHPWIVNQRKIGSRLYRLSYLKDILRHVSVLHACSTVEFEFLKQTGWNDYVVLIKNPTITNSVSVKDVLNQLFYLYTDTIQKHDLAIHQCFDQQIKKTGETDMNIIRICKLLLYIKYQFCRGEILQDTLTTLTHTMTTLSYDEVHLAETLQKLDIKRFTARIEQVAEEQMLLTEGFMPIDKIDDKITKQIRIKIQPIDGNKLPNIMT